jgi:hypothetical protein
MARFYGYKFVAYNIYDVSKFIQWTYTMPKYHELMLHRLTMKPRYNAIECEFRSDVDYFIWLRLFKFAELYGIRTDIMFATFNPSALFTGEYTDLRI